MRFAYGLCDFYRIITEQRVYVDRTDRLQTIEEGGDHLLFLRPRRFGKSLWLSTLENYYDVAKAAEFEKLFGHLKIGKNPTPNHHRYFVLKWDFSMVHPQGTCEQITRYLFNHINASIEAFNIHYRDYLPTPIALDESDAVRSFFALVNAIHQTTSYPLYLLIDEYDNFANEVLMDELDGRKRYVELVRNQGILKSLFKTIKGLSAGKGIEKVFITGVSPMVMSDVSSGYNIVKNITMRAKFHDLCGFWESEVVELLKQVADECDLSSTQQTEALDMMRSFYNGYSFSYEQLGTIYNPTLVLYFLENLKELCAYPRNVLDENLAMDRNRIRYVAQLPHGQTVVADALNPDNPLVISDLVDKFEMEKMYVTERDTSYMISLLYYLGVLTLSHQTPRGKLVMKIPNLVTRRLYVERLQELLLPTFNSRKTVDQVAEIFCSTGDIAPLCQFIENHYFKVFDNRDYRWSNELVVKTAFLVTLFNDIFYIMDSELETNKGYSDLSMIIRPDMRKFELLDHLLEFKYLKLGDLNVSAEQVRNLSQIELQALPPVQAELEKAQQQLARYRLTLEQSYQGKLRLHTHAIVAIGLEKLVWISTPLPYRD